MIKIEGTADEIKRLKDVLLNITMCPFGARDLIEDCLNTRDCEICINTNIKWEVLRNCNTY